MCTCRGADPTEASLHPLGSILHPHQRNESSKPRMSLLAPFLLQDPRLPAGSIHTHSPAVLGLPSLQPLQPPRSQCRRPSQAIPTPAGCLTLSGGDSQHPKGIPWAWHGKGFRASPMAKLLIRATCSLLLGSVNLTSIGVFSEGQGHHSNNDNI